MRVFKSSDILYSLYDLMLVWTIPLSGFMNRCSCYKYIIHSLKFKTVRRQPTPVIKNYISVLEEFVKYRGEMTVAIDVMYINKLSFLVSNPQVISFAVAEYFNNISRSNLIIKIN